MFDKLKQFSKINKIDLELHRTKKANWNWHKKHVEKNQQNRKVDLNYAQKEQKLLTCPSEIQGESAALTDEQNMIEWNYKTALSVHDDFLRKLEFYV